MGISFGQDSNIDRVRWGKSTEEPEWCHTFSTDLSSVYMYTSDVLVYFDVPAGKVGLLYGYNISNTEKHNYRLFYINNSGNITRKTIAIGDIGNGVSEVYNYPIAKVYSKQSMNISKYGTTGSGTNQYNTPGGICASGEYIYIVDSGNNRIVKVKEGGFECVSSIGTAGAGDDQFNSPYGICTDGTYLFVVDQGNCRIVKRLCSDLSYVSQIGSIGSGMDEFSFPTGICIDSSGFLYVVDSGNDRVVKRLSSTLAYDGECGSYGTGDDNFDGAYGICTDSTYIYVVDSGNYRVVKRKCSDLSFVDKFGRYIYYDCETSFSYPTGICINGGYLYISDNGFPRLVKVLASTMSQEYFWGVFGKSVGQLVSPVDITYLNNNFYITDSSLNGILKLDSKLIPVEHSIWITTSEVNLTGFTSASFLISYVDEGVALS